MLSSPSRVPDTPTPPQLVSLGWAMRRMALWLFMILVMVVVGAWLLDASIDPDEAAAGPSAPGENAQSR